ncbi:unnamed protein product [Chilo suppressalis]|uniref:Tyrosine-protein phosphatase domain-containing protein n=1 Tax=Chilo suppressalis TaxID=168631 RepID=A0ABN8BAQ1_CHISP|nr:unnamed protein product [Chilo suppressalis]
MIWLIRNLPRRTPRNSAGNVISLLEYFLSMDETNFWMVMDRCPECTSNLLIIARDRHLQRKANRLANMIAQEDVLEIEGGKEKCFPYWSEEEQSSLNFQKFKVTTTKIERFPHYVKTTLLLTD